MIIDNCMIYIRFSIISTPWNWGAHMGRIFQSLNLESKLPNLSVGKLKSPTNNEGWEE